MKVYFDRDAPLTAAILGAAVSGGDAIGLAKALAEVNPQEPFVIPADWECPSCGYHDCPGCQPHPSQQLSCFV